MAHKMSGVLWMCIVAAFLILGTLGQDSTYSEKYCFACPPGYYVQNECKEFFTNSTCAVCPNHYYSDTENINKYCKLCKGSCPKSSRIISECSPTTNRKCECHDGFHKYPVDPIDDHWECRQHKECPKGQGEEYYGNHTHDTRCRACQHGAEFVNTSNSKHPTCQPCTECSVGRVVVRACSMDADTLCRDGENVTTLLPDVTTTTTITATSPSNTANSAESKLTEPGAIFAIVWGIMVAVGLIGLVLILCQERKKPTGIKKKHWILGFLLALLMIGFFINLIVLVVRQRRTLQATNDTETDLRQASNGNASGQHDDDDAL